MKLIGVTLAMAACCALAATAQEIKTTTKEKSKIEIKGGKDVEVNGCVDRSACNCQFRQPDGRYRAAA